MEKSERLAVSPGDVTERPDLALIVAIVLSFLVLSLLFALLVEAEPPVKELRVLTMPAVPDRGERYLGLAKSNNAGAVSSDLCFDGCKFPFQFCQVACVC